VTTPASLDAFRRAVVVTSPTRRGGAPTTDRGDHVTDRRPAASTADAFITALLPRDWPRRLDLLLLDARPDESDVQLLARVKRLVDGWVLAGVDALDVLVDAVEDVEADDRG
jgi:hypothetical protein